MKDLFKSITILLFLISSIASLGQTSVIDFTLTSDTINISGQSMPLSSTITKADNTIVWTQFVNGNSNITSFAIVNTTGNWDQETSIGSMTYNLNFEDNQISLLVSGQETGILATLSHINQHGANDNYVLDINTIAYQ